MTDSTQMVVARTLWGEARGTGAAGMTHVANVICNRVAKPGWWGRDFTSVCLAPYQFSCWLETDPNRAKLEAVTEEDPWFAIAMGIADKAIAGTLPDATGGADSYYALSMKHPPAWSRLALRTFSDGWHVFYRTSPEMVPHALAPTYPPDVSADELNAQQLAKDQSA